MKNGLVVIIVIVIAVVFVTYFNLAGNVYEKNYYRKIGIKNSFRYESVIESMGKPIKEVEEIVHQNGYIWLNVYYEDCKLEFSKKIHLDKDAYKLRNVQITSSKIQFGKKKIGIGSTYEQVKKAYKKIQPMVDVDCGYVDKFTWIEFEFDESNKVNKMMIYDGP